MYTVTVQLQDGTSLHHDLKDGGAVVVGRTRQSDFVIESDHAVSSRHLRLSDDGGQLYVEDLGSTNGSYLESERLEPGRLYPLSAEQPLYIGASLLTVAAELSWEKTRIGGPTYKPKFVGVLYTDIVQSTAMTARLGQERALAVLEWHNQMFRERFKKFAGRETKFTGDGFEAVFASVNDALSCAASCQRALARRNYEDTSGLVLDVRMGINGGEAPTSGKKVFGMPLILAARVMSEASAAQIFVPDHVMGIVAGSLWRFAPLGQRQLKGLEHPVALSEVLWRADPNLLSQPEVFTPQSANGKEPGKAGRRRPTQPIQ